MAYAEKVVVPCTMVVPECGIAPPVPDTTVGFGIAEPAGDTGGASSSSGGWVKPVKGPLDKFVKPGMHPDLLVLPKLVSGSFLDTLGGDVTPPAPATPIAAKPKATPKSKAKAKAKAKAKFGKGKKKRTQCRSLVSGRVVACCLSKFKQHVRQTPLCVL